MINPFHLPKCMVIITDFYASSNILAHDAIPMTLGGDHTITFPILRAIKEKHGAVGLVHIDAHADINDHQFGEPTAHGTPFRRCVEEGLINGNRTVQIGLRGSSYAAEDFDWPREQGFRVGRAEECWYKSFTPLMEEAREKVAGGPVYLSMDIDGLDPAFAPGTGTPEVGG